MRVILYKLVIIRQKKAPVLRELFSLVIQNYLM